jgi:fermentation-respiration switch protein FrsA (DUF1100 family)
MKWLAQCIPAVPLGFLAKLWTPFTGNQASAIEEFNYWPENTEKKVAKKLHQDGFHGVSTRVLMQLQSGFEPGGLRPEDSSTPYMKGLSLTDTPFLAIAGDHDKQCPPDASEKTFNQLGSTHKEFLVFGAGHFDLLLGHISKSIVYPRINDWLKKYSSVSKEL